MPPERMREAESAFVSKLVADFRDTFGEADSAACGFGESVANYIEARWAAYAVDSRPSLDLTDEEIYAVLRWLVGAAPQKWPDDVQDGRLLDCARKKFGAELGRRQGTGQ